VFETAKLGIPPAPELGRPIPTLSFAHANVVKPSVLAVVNVLTYGLLKSNNSLFTGDIIEYSRDLTGVSFNDDTGESFPEYEYYPFIEIHFENGLATSSWKWYNTKNYKIELEINYKDGNLHGVSNEWNMSGDLILVEVWDEGELIFENIY